MANNYKLFVNKKLLDKNTISEINWNDNIDGLSTTFSFQTTIRQKVGYNFTFLNGSKVILKGVITDESYDKKKTYQYSGFDFGFYLNKNEAIIQFKGVDGHEAIKQLLNSFDTPIGDIDNIPIKIKKIYKKIVVSDIIKDILDQAHKKTGQRYLIDCKNGRVNIQKFRTINLSARYELSKLIKVDITDTVSNFSASQSIQDLKNKILITDNKEDNVYKLAEVQDSQSISEFGLIQKIENPDEESKQSNIVIARNLLKELNKVKITKSADMLGVDEVESGVILPFNYPDYDFVGNYLVNQVDHTVKNDNNHTMKVDLEEYNG